MPRRKPTVGACVYCGKEMTRGGMPRHVSACPQRREVIAKADKKPGKKEALFHLRVQDAWGGDFWLDLEMAGSSRLEDLDYYLRRIWLECCGHMSAFRENVRSWAIDDIPMETRARDVFAPGVVLRHLYDFGTASETLVKVHDVRNGKPTTRYPIALMARNSAPKEACVECGQVASHLCQECLVEENKWAVFCDQHAKTHPHGDYGDPIPLVNSPRVGMCGYCGPADPPY